MRSVALAGLFACLTACVSERGDDPAGSSPGEACPALPPRPAGTVIAGSGPTLALVRALARESGLAGPGANVRIPDSIGTDGAVRALIDGAIDLGVASRPLSAEERSMGLVEVPFARSPLAFVVPRGADVRALGAADIAALYRGARRTWPDGTPVVLFLREPGDSGERLVAGAFPEVSAAMAESFAARRWTVCYTDGQMAEALAATPGAAGFLDLSTVRLQALPVVPVAIDGVSPTLEAVGDRAYPLVRTFSFLLRGPPDALVARFLADARSPRAAELLGAAGASTP